jgi:ABC-type transport system involved in multi-copper enzyme maturation permease subunit
MHSVWAVARNTISQTLRIRAAVVFVLLLIVLLPLMSIYMVGDGTLLGRLQTFVSYGLSLTSMLLSLFTIVVSTFTLTSEIEQRQIYSLITKPVTRFQLLAGKLLGVLIIDALLLALFAGSIYVMAINIPRFTAAASEQDQMKAATQFFTARTTLQPVTDEAALQKDVDEAYQKLVKADPSVKDIPVQKAKAELRKQQDMARRAVAPGGRLVWQFNDVRPAGQGDVIFLRYRLESSSDLPQGPVAGRWYLGRYEKDAAGVRIASTILPIERSDAIRTIQEIPISASVVGETGSLSAVYLSSPGNAATTIFPPEKGPQILYRSGTFDGNYLRGVIVLYSRLAFLAMLGISLATWLSFPVAILGGLVVFFTASMSGFIAESMSGATGVAGFFNFAMEAVMLLLPKFDQFNPSEYMVTARMLSWQTVLWVFSVVVCLKGAVLWLIGLYAFSRREMARVIV